MEWKFSLPKPSMQVYYFAKIVGLAPFTVKNNRLYSPTVVDILYLISIVAAYLIIAILTFQLRTIRFNLDDFSIITNILLIIQHFGNSPSVFLGLAIFLLMFKQIVYITNKLCDLSNDIKCMGIREDHEKYFNNILVSIVVSNVVLISACVVLCVLEPQWSIYISIKYSIECWFILNMVLGFAQILFYIKRRFALINEKLSEPFMPIYHARSFDDLRTFARSRKPRSENFADLQRVRSIEAVHLELDDLVDRTTNLFAALIILISIHALALLILSFYWICINYRNSTESPFSYATCPLIRTIILVVELFTITYASTTTCYEGNATRDVLSKMSNASMPKNLDDEFLIFSLQLLHKPVAVSVLDFFILDYSYLYKIFYAVLGYLIIVMQLENTRVTPFLMI